MESEFLLHMLIYLYILSLLTTKVRKVVKNYVFESLVMNHWVSLSVLFLFHSFIYKLFKCICTEKKMNKGNKTLLAGWLRNESKIEFLTTCWMRYNNYNCILFRYRCSQNVFVKSNVHIGKQKERKKTHRSLKIVISFLKRLTYRRMEWNINILLFHIRLVHSLLFLKPVVLETVEFLHHRPLLHRLQKQIDK